MKFSKFTGHISLSKRFGLLTLIVAACAAMLLASSTVQAGQIYYFDDLSLPGLSAEAEFTLINSTTLQIRLKNTSTGVPGGFSNSDQILTGISWDFGEPGYNGDALITGGTVVIGPSSGTLEFDTGTYGPGYDVSGEYGYGNMDGTGALTNFVSANTAQSTPFGGANLDGPVQIDGPQGGLIADPAIVALGGLGAIQNEIIATLTLSEAVANLDFLSENLVRVEFGSDAAFITVPEPGTIGILAIGSLIFKRRKS